MFPGYAFAYELNDTDANIIGHVTDKDTKEHLAYVTIMLKGTTIGTTTDETGHYFLKNLSEGTFTVEVSSIGYKTERRTVQLTKGKTLELNFEIGEDHVALEGVVVSANRNETTRRMAPTLVNVVSVKTFENTNSTCLAQGLNVTSSRVCVWRTTARTADISRCASTDWTGLIRRFSSTRVPSSARWRGYTVCSRFLPT